ncbi:uncharacterized protein LOC141703167 isoform X2 [Apium graveolens]|uniref:uncharacterized protein LOC141703167 isoform X2 n=1 Tax=Apium graveolens TaxID=4045 RepID=UPI003D797DD1
MSQKWKSQSLPNCPILLFNFLSEFSLLLITLRNTWLLKNTGCAKCYSYSHHEVLKCNDDTCIRVDTVMKELEKVSGKRLLYMGNHNLLHRPLRSGNCHFSKGFKRCLNIRVDHDLQKVWTLGKGLLYLKYHQRYQVWESEIMNHLMNLIQRGT